MLKFTHSVVMLAALFQLSFARGQELVLTPADEYAAIETRDGASPQADPVKPDPDKPNTFPIPNGGSILTPIQTPDAPPIVRSPGTSPPVVGSPPITRPPLVGSAPRQTPISLPPKVDLRKYLPTPGNQKDKNDCVAWALGYASYSCQICQSRDKSPTELCDTFSPAFIYNKLQKNGKGLCPKDAIDLLKDEGCASLATMPQSQSQPTKAAMVEAETFCAIDHQRARNLTDIKTFLSEGYPVVLIVFPDTQFNSPARATTPYKWSATGRKGLHAVCAVGYDDEQRALLIMNSAGPSWKDGGFCWASYDNFRANIDNKTDSNWCAEAHVVKVKRSRPITVWTTKTNGGHAFQLKDDLKVYDDEKKAVTPDGWKVHDVAYAEDGLFVLRDNRTVAMMEGNGNTVLPSWQHLNYGDLSTEVVAMLAADPSTELHVLTGSGKIFEYVKTGLSDGRWRAIQLPTPDPSNAKVVDLRMIDEELRATLYNGQVYTLGESGWSLKTDDK